MALKRQWVRVLSDPPCVLNRRVWSPGLPRNLSVLRTHLMHLHRKLGQDGSNPKYIFTEPRVGYWMPREEAPGEETPATS